MLMGAAEVLAGMKADLAGSVVFLFQPAEEGAPFGEEGGAVFGLHVFPFEAGSIFVRPAGIMAAGDTIRITVRGRQTHGALLWEGVDPIGVAPKGADPAKVEPNHLIRKGLASGKRPAGSPPRFTIVRRTGGFRPGVDPLELNQLSDELDVERFVRQHQGEASR